MEIFLNTPDVSTSVNEHKKIQFLQNGFIRLDNILDEEERLRLLEIYDQLFDSTNSINKKQLGGKDAKGRPTLPQILMPSRQVPELLKTRCFSRVQSVAKYILGDAAEFRNDHMILKPAGYGVATPWHQDQSYHDPSFRYTTINFWMPLEDATVENGCMHFVPQSHQGPVLPHTYLIPGDKKSAMVATDQEYWQSNSVPVTCPKGSVTLHHSYMLHYAGPNITRQARRAYIMVFALPPVKLEKPWVFPWKQEV
jgi:ectoine hydroxylase-related dioxygenase (phytanoyl-CoA dioxygenase family)